MNLFEIITLAIGIIHIAFGGYVMVEKEKLARKIKGLENATDDQLKSMNMDKQMFDMGIKLHISGLILILSAIVGYMYDEKAVWVGILIYVIYSLVDARYKQKQKAKIKKNNKNINKN